MLRAVWKRSFDTCRDSGKRYAANQNGGFIEFDDGCPSQVDAVRGNVTMRRPWTLHHERVERHDDRTPRVALAAALGAALMAAPEDGCRVVAGPHVRAPEVRLAVIETAQSYWLGYVTWSRDEAAAAASAAWASRPFTFNSAASVELATIVSNVAGVGLPRQPPHAGADCARCRVKWSEAERRGAGQLSHAQQTVL